MSLVMIVTIMYAYEAIKSASEMNPGPSNPTSTVSRLYYYLTASNQFHQGFYHLNINRRHFGQKRPMLLRQTVSHTLETVKKDTMAKRLISRISMSLCSPQSLSFLR